MQSTSSSLDVLHSSHTQRKRSSRHGWRLKHEQSLPDLAEFTTPSNSRPPSRVSGVYDTSTPSTRMFNLRKSMSLETMQKRTKENEYPKIRRFQSDSRLNKGHDKPSNYSIKRKIADKKTVTKNTVKSSILEQTNTKLKRNDNQPTNNKFVKPYVTLPRYFRPQRQNSFVKPIVTKGPERPIIVSGDLNKITESMIQHKHPARFNGPTKRKEVNNNKNMLFKSPYAVKPKANGFLRRKQTLPKSSKIEPYELHFGSRDTYESRKFANSDYNFAYGKYNIWVSCY